MHEEHGDDGQAWPTVRRGGCCWLVLGRKPASDAADVDSRRPQLVHYLLIGFGIGDDDVDVVEIADMAERHPAELRGVGHRDDPLRGFGGAPLHRRLGE